VRVEVVIVTSY